MKELIERMIWFLIYAPDQDVPVPRELAGRVIAEWATLRHGLSPQPATVEGTSPESVNQGDERGSGPSR